MVEGFNDDDILFDEVMECGFVMLKVVVESLKGFEFDFVRIVVIYMLCRVCNVCDFISVVKDIFFYFIEVIFGVEEVWFIYLGVVYINYFDG